MIKVLATSMPSFWATDPQYRVAPGLSGYVAPVAPTAPRLCGYFVSGVECEDGAAEHSLEITGSYGRTSVCGGANPSIGRHGSFTTFAGAGAGAGAAFAIGIAGDKSDGVGAGCVAGLLTGLADTEP